MAKYLFCRRSVSVVVGANLENVQKDLFEGQ